jgi:hypothetical protein
MQKNGTSYATCMKDPNKQSSTYSIMVQILQLLIQMANFQYFMLGMAKLDVQ